MKNKRGYQIGDLMPLVVTFIVIAVALALGAEVLSEMRTTQDDNEAAYGNQTLVWGGNNTGIGLAEAGALAGSFVLYNNGAKIARGEGDQVNYTGSRGIITITNYSGSGVEWITDALNLSYDYGYGSYARNITGYGLDANTTMSKWLPTIALVIVIAIILGILIVYMARRYT
jgi:hypothetical protein